MGAGIRRLETQRVLSDQGERYCRAWLPAEPRRVIVIAHGFAEHTGRYDEMAMHFARHGFAVHAYDQAGHGRTRGPRGHVDRFDRLVEELARFIELIGLDHPSLPITLVGHSMGGLVAAGTSAFHRPAVDRIILSGSLLQLGGASGGTRQRLSLLAARTLSVLAPRFGIATGLDPAGLSRDPEVVRRYSEDPFVKDRMSTRFAAGLNQMVERVSMAAGQIERPVLVLHGESDPICTPRGSLALHAGLAPSIAQASALKIYPELRHEIFQEPEREQVWQDMLDWMDGREDVGVDSSADRSGDDDALALNAQADGRG
jgi:alpha-beta hydrolase superfamily lysophospholipase